MKMLTIQEAARQLDTSPTEVAKLIQQRQLGAVYEPLAAIPQPDVTKLVRAREAKERQAKVGHARALFHLPADIEAEERFLAGIGCSSSPRLEALKEELTQRREETRKPSPLIEPASEGRASRKRAASIVADFESRMAKFKVSRAKTERLPEGTWETRVRTLNRQHLLPENLRTILRRFAAKANSEGRSFRTHVNGQRVTITPDGEFQVDA